MELAEDRLVERVMIELDPGRAAHYLTFNNYESQRNVREPYVQILAEKMVNGLFRFGEVAFITIKGGRDIMVNGQHVCHAVVMSGKTVPCMLEKFKTNTDVGASEVFRQFEILPRSLRDMLAVEARALNLDWPSWVTSLVVGAATVDKVYSARGEVYYPSGQTSASGRKHVITKEDKAEMLSDYIKEGGFANRILTGAKFKREAAHISRVPVVLAIFSTWRKDIIHAKCFWERVRDGDVLAKDDPEMLLRNFLIMLKGRGAVNRKQVTNKEIMAKCISAWNAFRSGRKMKKISYNANKPVPRLL